MNQLPIIKLKEWPKQKKNNKKKKKQATNLLEEVSVELISDSDGSENGNGEEREG